jgi:hypothetical protein
MGNLLHVILGVLRERQCLKDYLSKKHARTGRQVISFKISRLGLKRGDAGWG